MAKKTKCIVSVMMSWWQR